MPDDDKVISTNCGAQTTETSERRRNYFERRALISKRVDKIATMKRANANRSAAQRKRWEEKRAEMSMVDPVDTVDKTVETAGDPDHDIKDLPDLFFE